MVYSNTASVGTERLLPGSIRLRAQIYREDLWYNQGNRGLPNLREGAQVLLESERPDTRFKPYFRYDAFRRDEEGDFQHTFTIGIKGPITDYLQLRAEYGYYFGGDFGSGSVWEVALYHQPNPQIRHSLIYTRSFTDFRDEIYEWVGYSYWHLLGPRLSAEAYLYDLDVKPTQADVNDPERNEIRAGLRFTLTPGPKTSVRLSGNYAASDINHEEFWTGRLEIGYSITDTLLARLLYQYRYDTSDLASNNFTENLFYFSLTKFFR
jgi:hypothetical protein